MEFKQIYYCGSLFVTLLLVRLTSEFRISTESDLNSEPKATETPKQVEEEIIGTKSYEGYRLLTVIPRTESAAQFLAKLAESEESTIDFWQEPRMLFHNATFSVAPEAYGRILEGLLSVQMVPYVISDNLQELLDAERKQLGLARKKRSTDSVDELKFDQYNRHPVINKFLEDLDKSCSICSVINIGSSHEGRAIKLIKIGKNESAPGIFIDAGIHAREWIAPATALYILNQLLGLRNSGSGSKWLLETYTWYILPVVNPDGYEYSWDHDRLWRKSRSKHEGNECTGTDLNRNFDFHWREIGASSHPCASTYAGPNAFSEPESRALSSFLASKRDELIGYITLHSYGQYWLTPWGFTRTLPNDYNHLAKVAHKATRALRRVHGRYYMVGSSTNVYYAAAGGSDDWAKGAVGIKYSYTVELRRPWWEGRGFGGFILDRNEIRPQGQEFWAALRAMAREIRTRL